MKSSRRKFIKTALASGAAIGLSSITTFAENKEGRIELADSIFEQKKKNRNVVGLSCEPLDKVRIGFIGLGMRGPDAVSRMMKIDGVEIKALCDLIPERVKSVQEMVKKEGRPEALEFYGSENAWMRMCERDDIDLVYSCTPWDLHVPNAIYAMKHGKHAAIEVPAATTVKDCWELVNTAESTRRHCMMLENCCYDFFELATLNMERQGLLGEIVHAECAYIHDLRWLKFDKEKGYQGMWRLKYSMRHTGNLYPTHGLGPVAQIMNINRGDKFDYLTSMSSNQFGMSLYAKEKFGEDSLEAKQSYKLGDMNTTLVRTYKGKTIMIQHDTTSPRPYSRIHILSGTKNSRLQKNLLFDNQIAQDVSSFQYSARLSGSFIIISTAKPGIEIDKIKTEIIKEIENLIKNDVTDEELIRAKNSIKSSYIYSLQKLDTIVDHLNHYNFFLNEPDAFLFDISRYEKVTKDNVITAAEKFLKKPFTELNIVPKSK